MIDARHDGGVATLALTHTARGNALGTAMTGALAAPVDAAIADPSVHTLVLVSSGRDFCTGFDLSDVGDVADIDAMGADEAAALDARLLARFVRIEQLLATLWHAPLRTVAVASGRAFGAGADLFAACDLRLATGEAQWRFPGAGFGIVLGTRRLAEQVGAARALQWVGSGQAISPDQALAAGLASHLIPAGDAATWQAALPPLAVGRATYAALRAAARADRRGEDLAALVQSAAAPGLARRIAGYRAGLRRAAGKTDDAARAGSGAS